MASGVWNYLVFFGGLVVSGGFVEYMISRRYVTKDELKTYQSGCRQHILDQLEIALLKNNERLEDRMIAAVTEAIKEKK